MKISIIQMDMKFAEPEYNYKKAESLIRQAAMENTDIICLPETWNTGFFPKENLKYLSDKNGQKTQKIIGSLAKELNVNIVAGSVANLKDEKIYNSSFIFDRHGNCIAEYDKTHLFTYMNEDDYFESGKHISIFELDGIRCGIIICYDIRFPELVRTLALNDIDILFAVAQWPDVRVNHWEILNLARAIENQIFAVCVNSCGIAGKIKYAGHSAIIGPFGEIIGKCSSKEEILTSEINIDSVKNIRNTINIYRDRKPELYTINSKNQEKTNEQSNCNN